MPKKHEQDDWSETNEEKKLKPIVLQPALRQIGTTECPICKRDVAVFLTKTNRPFVNCSYCSARIFYNGLEPMRLLKKHMEPVEEEPKDAR